MEFLWSMFQTPEAQVGAYPWASAFAGHAFVGVLLLILCGAVAWVYCAALRRLAVAPARRPSTYALWWAVPLYALWEVAQVIFAGGGVVDGLVDWAAVACGTLIGWGAWRGVIIPVAIGVAMFLLIIIEGIRNRRNPFN